MAVPVEELQSFLKGFAPSTQHPNNPLAQGAMPSANRAAPQFNPNLPGSYTNPSNPNLNPSLPGALNNPANPQFNPNMPGAINNPSNPQRNPSLPSSLTNPSNPQMNPAFPGSFTNPSNPINNPDFPTPSEYPPPAGIGPDASVPPSRWSTFSPRQASHHQLWFTPQGGGRGNGGNWGKGLWEPHTKTLWTWPEEEASHLQMAKDLKEQGYPYDSLRTLGISPKGEVHAYGEWLGKPSADPLIAEADPRLFVPEKGSFGPKIGDNWQKDNRDWPDPTEPRAAKPPALKGCTCHEGDKLNCPVHGLNAGDQDLDHTWHLPENNPVNYPSDAPRNWQQAFGKEADYYHAAPTVDRERIRQHGLQPSQPARNERWWTPLTGQPPAWLQRQPEGVYVSDDPERSRAVWTADSLEDPDQSAWDTWRIPHEQAEGVYPDPVAGPFNRVIPHEVYPELYEGGPEIFGPWPERRSSVLSPLLTIN